MLKLQISSLRWPMYHFKIRPVLFRYSKSGKLDWESVAKLGQTLVHTKRVKQIHEDDLLNACIVCSLIFAFIKIICKLKQLLSGRFSSLVDK